MGSGDYVFLLWIIPIVFISLLLLLSYKIVSKINHKKRSSSKHKTISDFTYQNLKENPSNKI
jgi:cytochrome c-type biogenesis protein CcmH/NrfF